VSGTCASGGSSGSGCACPHPSQASLGANCGGFLNAASPSLFGPGSLGFGSPGNGLAACAGAATTLFGGGHDISGACRHGPCSCFCECVCACECIARNTSSCNCVPIEARGLPSGCATFAQTGATLSTGLQHFSEAFGRGINLAPSVSSGGAFGFLPQAGAAVSSPFITSTSSSSTRKRQSAEMGGMAAAQSQSLFPSAAASEPAVKKVIRQTMDIRGNLRSVAIDAAEAMLD